MCCLRYVFSRFGIPEKLLNDEGKEFIASPAKKFFKRWGIHHRDSSAYNPQSNGRAEVAVKTAKRLLQSNTGPDGSLDTDKFLRAILQLRNSPDPDCNLSPAQIIFGRPLRDAFGFVNRLEKYTNPHIRPVWRDAWRAKEEALRERFHRTSEALNEHAHPLPPLVPGDRCYVQNQYGNRPKKWDRSGTVVESLGFDSYNVKIDGSGRITKRNRRYLRKYTPATIDIAPSVSAQPVLAPPMISQNIPHAPILNTPHTVTTPVTPNDPPSAAPLTNDIIDPIIVTTEPAPSTLSHESPTPPIESDSRVSDEADRMSTRRRRRAPKHYEPETGNWV